MRYNTKKWLESVIELKGIQPFSMYQLPKHLRVKSEIKPLIENGILICEGSKRVREKKHYVKIWRVSPAWDRVYHKYGFSSYREMETYVRTEAVRRGLI